MMVARHSTPGMRLSDLLHGLVEISAGLELLVQGLKLDSREIVAGDLFIAVPGLTVDGRKFIEPAIRQGACAVVWECDHESVPIPVTWRTSVTGEPLPVIAVDNLTHKVGVIADRYYQAPSKSLFTVGITGTNGKTSCSQFIAQALDAEQHCGVMGTMGWGFLGELHDATHTTPDAISCHRQLEYLRQHHASAVAMEVSSHALDQGRVNGVHFDCVVFTNLTHDHLDYHGDMQSYADAKARLFQWPEVKTQVINHDDAYGRVLIRSAPAGMRVLSYGLDDSNGEPDLFATDIRYHADGISLQVQTPFGSGQLDTALYGQFNVYNLLACLGVLLSAGMTFPAALQRLSRLVPVGGRMQVIRRTDAPLVIVDYAHTPDALQQVLSAVREHHIGELWCVFGCGGNRDKAKRPLMGGIAETFAEHVVLTSDNPRTESAQMIIEQIRAGMRDPARAIVEPDRRRAIGHALRHAQGNDVVLIAGKGHETYQQIGAEKFPFSDQQVVEDILTGVAP